MSGPRHTETIEDVLEALQETIDDSAADESRVGYFAALYRQVTVLLDGEPTDVLIQAFERRVLTYTPSNPSGWKVESGNIGRHYYQWYYGPHPEE